MHSKLVIFLVGLMFCIIPAIFVGFIAHLVFKDQRLTCIVGSIVFCFAVDLLFFPSKESK